MCTTPRGESRVTEDIAREVQAAFSIQPLCMGDLCQVTFLQRFWQKYRSMLQVALPIMIEAFNRREFTARRRWQWLRDWDGQIWCQQVLEVWDKIEPKFRREAAAAADAKLPGEYPPFIISLHIVNSTMLKSACISRS